MDTLNLNQSCLVLLAVNCLSSLINLFFSCIQYFSVFFKIDESRPNDAFNPLSLIPTD